MEKNYKILTKFIKDISVETKDAQTYLFVKENIRDYHLKISINSKAIKNKMIEIDTGLIFEDKKANEFRSNFEMTYLNTTGELKHYPYFMDPDKEGKMLFFPASMKHAVHPFYGCPEERISISGNLYYTQLSGVI